MQSKPNDLQPRLGFFPIYNIVVANIIGAGIFTTSGILMGTLGNVSYLLLLWFAGGIVALCGALSYSELGIAIPRAGGEYTFLSQLFSPALGFLSGWVSFIAGFSAPIAASAIGFGEYFFRALPSGFYTSLFGLNLSEMPIKKVLAILVIFLFTFIHARGVRIGARIQNWLTLMKIGLLLLLILFGFWLGKGDWQHFSFSQTLMPSGFGGISTIGLSLLWVMFAYSGWNAATYIGSEIKNPRINLPKALIGGTITVMVLYLALNIFFIYAIPPDEMAGVVSVAGLAVKLAFGINTEMVVSLLISFALFSSLSAYLILGPRVYYAMAGDGLFFKPLAHVSQKSGVPSRAILLQGLISAIMVISGTFEQILTYMGVALGIFPIVAVWGIFRLRKLHPGAVRMPGFPFVQIVFLGASIAMLILTLKERTLESVIALASVLAGLPVYFYFKTKYPG